MRPSRNVIEQRDRDHVVSYRAGDRMHERVWSTREQAVKYARLMLEAGYSEVMIDGRVVYP